MKQIFSQRMLLAFTLPIALAATSFGEVTLPANAPACVQWASHDVTAVLSAAGIPAMQADVQVSIAATSASQLDEQSFSLKLDGTKVMIHAGGATGAMYGLQELAEQLSNKSVVKTWPDAVKGLHATTQRPYVEIRADNPFIHVYPLLLSDLPMWRDYIDMLARNRFNLLDMHGSYDLESTSFPNLYPMLIHVPEYPNVGNEQEQAKNLDNFRTIIAYAKSRGVKVSFMNYSANNGRGGEFKNEPSVTGVPADKLEDYTAKAVTLLIKQLPDLYMLGFRVGESGQEADFFKKSYIKGVQDANRPDLRLYTRSWQTTLAQLEPIAQAARNGFDIEIKYNGEQLGLPYHAMQGAEFGTYSYQAYLDVPADYNIIWQVRANGTHRFWAWENTDFIRRTVKTFTLGSARGFTLEPLTAYFSVYPQNYYKSAADIAVYKYIWQRHWMWYYAWGRMAYNPELPEANLEQQYQKHYGAAGDTAYQAMQQSGKIVPLAYAYRFVGPDQRDFSPETETGNFDTKKKRSRLDLLQFAENKPEDQRSFAGIDDYVSHKLAGTPDGRIGPFAAAAMFTSAAQQTRALLAAAPKLTGHTADEWRLLADDLNATTYFADYYAARIHGMTYLDFALRTGSDDDYKLALDDLAQSRADWKQLGVTTDSYFKPLSNPLRRQSNFQWSGENARLEKLDETATSFWQQSRGKDLHVRLTPSLADMGQDMGLRITALSHQTNTSTAIISCNAFAPAGVSKVMLWWKPLPSEAAWQSLAMNRSASTSQWTASVPLDHHGLMYMVEVQDSRGHAKNFPEEQRETPYRVIPAYAEAK
jgi:hypothetical protein